MRLLLDTHIWLWSHLEPERLRPKVAAELESPANELWLSSISVWETLVLAARGRVVLEPDPARWVAHALLAVPLRDAPVNREVAVLSRALDLPHDDPADRFLAATAQVYDLTLVTADQRLRRLKGVQVLRNR